ncbi:MAG: hypothetical protein J1D86_05925 [Alistipes sp.]|nr:hypothetical protein [Alistipes sp.]
MESEIRDILSREINELEELISKRTAEWKHMKEQHELRWKYRRENPEHDSDDEIEWEQSSSIATYYSMYIEPLEEQLAEKRRSLGMFD